MSSIRSLAAIAKLPRAAALPALVETLAGTERLPADALEREQMQRLGELVRHARETVPFYSGLPPIEGELTAERFRDLPLLHRADLQEHGAELLAREIPAGHEIVRTPNSSGSIGTPVTASVDAAEDAVIEAVSMRDHAWHRRDLTQKAASIRAVPDGSADAPAGRHDARWSPHPRSGPLATLNVHTPVREQLAWLGREEPAYIVTYASNAAALVAEAERAGVEMPALREVGAFGGVLHPDLRALARRVWRVPVVDAYSSAELGFVALQCPDHEHYHVQSEHVFIEILRDDGTSCEAGETGRVVVTPLHAFAMPLIRYELGDYARVGGPCPCGRGLPVIEAVLGRVRNMLVLPGGGRLWPRFGSNAIGRVAPVRQFRLVQESLEQLVLQLVVREPLAPDTEARVRQLVLDTVRYPFELRLEYRNEIPRSPGGKFEDFLSLLDQNSQ